MAHNNMPKNMRIIPEIEEHEPVPLPPKKRQKWEDIDDYFDPVDKAVIDAMKSLTKDEDLTEDQWSLITDVVDRAIARLINKHTAIVIDRTTDRIQYQGKAAKNQ